RNIPDDQVWRAGRVMRAPLASGAENLSVVSFAVVIGRIRRRPETLFYVLCNLADGWPAGRIILFDELTPGVLVPGNVLQRILGLVYGFSDAAGIVRGPRQACACAECGECECSKK